MIATLVELNRSQFLAALLLVSTQANVRSTIQRFGNTLKDV
jgi:hypothetical protein